MERVVRQRLLANSPTVCRQGSLRYWRAAVPRMAAGSPRRVGWRGEDLSWLHQFRRLRVRWEHRADIHRALLFLAFRAVLWVSQFDDIPVGQENQGPDGVRIVILENPLDD